MKGPGRTPRNRETGLWPEGPLGVGHGWPPGEQKPVPFNGGGTREGS